MIAASAPTSIDRVQALWRELAGDAPAVEPSAPLAGACRDQVLAACGEGGVVLLSDVDGAAIGATSRPALARHDFGRPVVLLLPGVAHADDMLPWLARAPARTRVVHEGRAAPLAALQDLAFGETLPARWRGRAALSAIAETRVTLAAGGAPLRLVVERLTDPRSGKVLAHRYVLASTALHAHAAQLLQWQAWRAGAQPWWRLLRDAQRQLAAGGFAQAQPAASVRVAEAVTTAWRLQHATADWAAPVRSLLAQLAGHRVRSGRAVPAAVLFEGMGKLCVLLDALADGDPEPLPQPQAVEWA